MTPGARVLPTRSKPNRRLAAERGRTGVVGNTDSLGLLHSAETAETAENEGVYTHIRPAYTTTVRTLTRIQLRVGDSSKIRLPGETDRSEQDAMIAIMENE